MHEKRLSHNCVYTKKGCVIKRSGVGERGRFGEEVSWQIGDKNGNSRVEIY